MLLWVQDIEGGGFPVTVQVMLMFSPDVRSAEAMGCTTTSGRTANIIINHDHYTILS